MEDKRTAIAILLIIMIVMLYSETVLAPSMRPGATSSSTETSASREAAPKSEPINSATLPKTSTTLSASQNIAPAPIGNTAGITSAPKTELPPTPAELAAAGVTTIETPLYIASLTHLGGRLTSLRLKNHKAVFAGDDLLDLVSSAEGGVLPLGVYSGQRSDLRTEYQIANIEPAGASNNRGELHVEPGKEINITLRGTLPDESTISKTIRFHADTYLLNITVALDSPAEDGTKVWLEWSRFLPKAIAEDPIDPWHFTLFSEASKIENITLHSLTLDGLSQPSAAQWLALSDKYFAAILLPETRGLNARYGRIGPQFLHRVSGSPSGGDFTVFTGPKDYEVLQDAGSEMERTVDLGFFSFLAYPLLILIKLFHSVFGNYGLAIVGLTLLIKGLFFPLTRASLRSMKSMQELQPEMKALRERIKDPTQLNQELMQLYKRKGVNPLGGCLPILLQIPVFFGLYSALLHALELRHAPFALWVTDLSVPESLTFVGINIPVMILLMGAAMFFQQWTTPMPSVDPAQKKMRLWLSAVFPISFLIFPFPSGLALYMLTNTSISLIQQAYLRNDTHANPGRATAFASVAIFGVAYVLTLI